MTAPRLLFAAPHTGVPGPIRGHTELLAEQFRKAGVETAILGWGRHADGESLLKKVSGRFADTGAILRHLSQQEPEVLVVRTAHDWKTLARDIPLVWRARRRAANIIVQFHGSQIERAIPGTTFGNATSVLARLVDGVLLLSNDERAKWEEFFPRTRVAVVDNAFAVWPEAEASAGREVAAELRDGIALVYVGRLIPEKGAYEALEAVAQLRDRVSATLCIVGSGPDEDRLRTRARELGVERDVEFAGQLNREKLAQVYLRSQCLVLPTYWAEGFPTVLSEAMSFGLPVITTPQRGARDHLGEEKNALFVPPKDSSAVAAAIQRLVNDHGMVSAMSTANRAVVAGFSPEAAAPRYLSAVESMCDEPFGARFATSESGATT
ncbi:MAG: glycosyltransferase [Coriobacteriia bacterium]|nr:glycosyltransferase [Coriobacteriia bacterium]